MNVPVLSTEHQGRLIAAAILAQGAYAPLEPWLSADFTNAPRSMLTEMATLGMAMREIRRVLDEHRRTRAGGADLP